MNPAATIAHHIREIKNSQGSQPRLAPRLSTVCEPQFSRGVITQIVGKQSQDSHTDQC
jgi:hypothetical protein